MSLYMLRGTGSAWWLRESDGEVGPGGPTSSQIDLALDLTDGVNAMSGFEPSDSPVNVAVLRSKQSYQIAGERTFGNPQIVVVEDDGTDSIAIARQAILETLEEDEAGTLIVFTNTQDPEPGDKCFFLKARVSSQVPSLTLDAAAQTTAINLAPQDSLKKGVLDPTVS
ncbi:MAG: hypothetical protein NVV70_16795 [Cellulomonas sp.]|nr:hypothetical protein [Cellulomonas sp.]MCR6649704.1 hypothetical protein [Cellulomonas sp.]